MSRIKSILTSKITIGVVCFILGALIFRGNSGIDITQERYNQLLEMEKTVLTKNKKEDTEEKQDAKQENKTESEKTEETIFGMGDTVCLSDKNGVKVMSLTINSAKLIDDRNQFSDKQADKVVEIEYTYDNIAMKENLQIFESNFKIYDASGNILENYPAGADKHPQGISEGKTCTASMSFALNNESNDLEIEYYENPYNKKPNGKFKITCE